MLQYAIQAQTLINVFELMDVVFADWLEQYIWQKKIKKWCVFLERKACENIGGKTEDNNGNSSQPQESVAD